MNAKYAVPTSVKTQPPWRATGVIVFLWLAYTALFALYLEKGLNALLDPLPGLLGVSALLASGFNHRDFYLRFAWPSKKGVLVLSGLFFLAVPIVWTGLEKGSWVGVQWDEVLWYAPLSGIAQELFFRSALLPSLLLAWRGKRLTALLVSAVLFAMYHVGMFHVAPAGGALAGLLVTFLYGLGLGWQVQNDRSVVWAMLHHAAMQAILRLFAWM